MMTYDCFTFDKEPQRAKFTLPIDFLYHLAFGTKCFIFRKKDSFVIFLCRIYAMQEIFLSFLISRSLPRPKNLSKSSISCEDALSHLEIDFAKNCCLSLYFSVLYLLHIFLQSLFDVLQICLCHMTQDADNLV